jgi:hypothetical protein
MAALMVERELVVMVMVRSICAEFIRSRRAVTQQTSARAKTRVNHD